MNLVDVLSWCLLLLMLMFGAWLTESSLLVFRVKHIQLTPTLESVLYKLNYYFIFHDKDLFCSQKVALSAFSPLLKNAFLYITGRGRPRKKLVFTFFLFIYVRVLMFACVVGTGI